MPEEIKFTEEEMNDLREIQKTYTEVQFELGQSAVNKIRLSQQIEAIGAYEDDLVKKFNEAQKKEKEFTDEVVKKYGDGTLDPKTGIFIKK